MTPWGFTLNNVTTRWSQPGKNILENISFSLQITDEQDAMLPLMGPSGQGKSTLLYLLAALKWPTTGEITWQFPEGTTYVLGQHGQHIHVDQAVQLRRAVFGFAFQDSTLSPYLTIIENIAYPLLLQGKKWAEALALAEAKLDDILLAGEKADKKTLMHRFPAQLSGGQRQRAALAQAIIHNPRVLFADEPTGQLDRHTRKQVMSVLKQWVKQGQGQRCLIWVTHHHVDDLDLMGIDKLLFVDNKNCIPRDRQWLAAWMNEEG